MIHSDIFLEIGKQHIVCEDYILQGTHPVPYIILSDGCSRSKNTEMGARILCHLAKQILKYYESLPIPYDKMGQWVIYNAEMIARQLGLPISCLDATLIVSYYFNNKIYTHMYGDGFYITDIDGELIITSVEFENNAPYYLSYQIDNERKLLYEKMNNHLTINHKIDGTNNQTILSHDHHLVFTEDVDEDFNLLWVSSDGLDTFLENGKTQSVEAIFESCTSFKSTKGECLKRRMKKQMKTFRKENITHYDDLSAGVFIKE